MPLMKMKNKKVIVLSGFARGGTNIVWNMLQSHPDICSPVYETGEIFRKSISLIFARMFGKMIPLQQKKIIVDSQLYQYKLKNLDHPDNRFYAENQTYTKKQISETAICLKSVNKDINLTKLLLDIYPNLYFIALTRNGYALAESYIRRGKSAAYAGKIYSSIAENMKQYSKKVSRFKMVKFEKCLQNPFVMAGELFSFVESNPDQLAMLRLKSKKVIDKQGAHSTTFGEKNRKYWFDRENIHHILNPDVNQNQLNRLTEKDMNDFNRTGGSALEFFGYKKLD